MEATSMKPTHDLAGLVGQIGEARTRVDDEGSVLVAGELWSARSEKPIPAGSSVRALRREGVYFDRRAKWLISLHQKELAMNELFGGGIACVVGVIAILAFIFLANAIRIVPEYQRLVVFRLEEAWEPKDLASSFWFP